MEGFKKHKQMPQTQVWPLMDPEPWAGALRNHQADNPIFRS